MLGIKVIVPFPTKIQMKPSGYRAMFRVMWGAMEHAGALNTVAWDEDLCLVLLCGKELEINKITPGINYVKHEE